MSQQTLPLPEVTVTRPEEADSLWVVRDRMRFVGEVAGTALAIVQVEVPPGSGTPPHRHASIEIFSVQRGQLTFGRYGDGGPTFITCEAGAVVTVPSEVPHNYQNSGDGPATMLVVVEQSMIAFFRDIGRAEAPPDAPPSSSEIAAVLDACARHGVTMLGGPPA